MHLLEKIEWFAAPFKPQQEVDEDVVPFDYKKIHAADNEKQGGRLVNIVTIC